jgi:hypothetical protein
VKLTLPKESFVALATVAWADGRISTGEGASLLRAAQASGLEGDDLGVVEAAIKELVVLDAFDPGAMSEKDRALTLALAYWLARVDGVSSAPELTSLRALGDKLGLSDFKQRSCESAAFDIACLPGGHRPEKYDFSALADKLVEKLPMLAG